MFKSFTATAALLALLMAGCDNASTTSSDAPPTPASSASSDALPTNLSLAAAPSEATGVAAMKASVKDGDRVVVTGIVGGRAEPIADRRAILTLLDAAVPTCDKNPEDGCKTPWDACCEPAEVLTRNSVTVQVVDAEGRPLRAPLSSLPGVKPQAVLTVSGVANVTADGVVLINADGIHAR